jgi:PAS domain S-box-containing protein
MRTAMPPVRLGESHLGDNDALASSERNLQLTVDSIPALAWSARPDGTADFLNKHFLDYVGSTLERMNGWQWTEAVHADDLTALLTVWEGLSAAGTGGEMEARLRRHDGTYRWFLFRANPQRDEYGNIVRWHGINTDIEDRKRAETLLAGEKHLLEMTASGRPLDEVLDAVCRFVEKISPECLCGIYPIDWSGPVFKYGVAPSLPASYIEPIKGWPVAVDKAPCGIAVAEDRQVIVVDVETDPIWRGTAYRDHVVSHGLRSAPRTAASWVRFASINASRRRPRRAIRN